MPSQRKKLDAILNHVVNDFEKDVRYPEKKVNEILSRFYTDTATLRRELIAANLMQRKNGEYWRVTDEI